MAKPTRVRGTAMRATILTQMPGVAWRAVQEDPFYPLSESRRAILPPSALPAKRALTA